MRLRDTLAMFSRYIRTEMDTIHGPGLIKGHPLSPWAATVVCAIATPSITTPYMSCTTPTILIFEMQALRWSRH